MLYAVLCYNSEAAFADRIEGSEAAVMEKLAAVSGRMAARGKLGPVARLAPTASATTLRKGEPPLIVDGPFAETKEQLLGFYVVDCEDRDEVLAFCRELAEASPVGTYEIRPLWAFASGGRVGGAAAGRGVPA